MKHRLFVAVLFLSLPCLQPFAASVVETVGRQTDGSVIVPTNQVLRPAGVQIEFPGRPFDVVLSPDEKTLFVKNVKDLLVMDVAATQPAILQSLPTSPASFHGIAISPDGKRLYETLSNGTIAAFVKDDAGKWAAAPTLSLSDAKGRRKGPVPGGLAIMADGRLCVALSRSNTLGIVDPASPASGPLVAEIPVGNVPYDVVIDTSTTAYVTNWGGRRAVAGDKTAPSAETPIVVDGKHFAAATGTVSVVDLASGKETATIEVGLHPSGMALDRQHHRLYVANANSDTVSVIDTVQRKVIFKARVRPDSTLPFGSAPNALCLSRDGQTLYVANGANNCVCVVDVKENGSELITRGLIPTAWYPGALALSRSGQLFIANVKGVGSLAEPPKGEKGHNSHETLASLSIVNTPPPIDQLSKWSTQVAENNRQNWKLSGLPADHDKPSQSPVPVPLFPGEQSVFKHVIYIIKENRTYDQVFGDMTQGNGDPSLCLFPRQVSPNHHALASEFALLDNYYCSGVLSVDGHFWADSAYVTDYLEKSFGGWPRSYPYAGEDAMAIPTSGFIWDGILAKGLSMRDYGEMVSTRVTPDKSNWQSIYKDFQSKAGKVKIAAKANVASLAPNTCPEFPGFVLKISDVQRTEIFLKEFRQYEAKGELPSFIIMMLPTDHTMGTNPGLPTPRAMVADNDLALGRIVEAVSHSRFWQETCIFVSEDDPQAGRDHVDAHRTVGLVISPYTRRAAVDSTNYNQTGMVRTMELILGLNAMNQFDRTATPMANCFQSTPNLAPYTCKPNEIPLDEVNPNLQSLAPKARHWAELSLAQDFSDADRANEDQLNRIIWHSVKGVDVPYPPQVKSNMVFKDKDNDDDEKDR